MGTNFNALGAGVSRWLHVGFIALFAFAFLQLVPAHSSPQSGS